MIIDETRYFWNNLMELLNPAIQLYSQLRPLILLPFNIWFFFVSLPFRLFFSVFTSANNKNKSASLVLKEKAIELKDTVTETVLPKTAQTHQVSAKSLELMEQRPHGWYAVEKKESKGEERLHKRKSSKSLNKEQAAPQLEKSQEEKPKEETNWNEKLSEMEKRVQSSSEEKLRLEAQFEELNKKYTDDEKVLASFENEKRRFRNLINVEQKKCIDSQLEIVSLRNQLKNEHESRLKAEQQLNSSMKQEKKEDMKEKKKSKKQTQQQNNVQETKETSVPETHSVWNSDHHMGFTEMVASAQLEESKHKKFSDVVKETIAPVEEHKPINQSSEFVVVGGDLSSKHIVGAPQISSSN